MNCFCGNLLNSELARELLGRDIFVKLPESLDGIGDAVLVTGAGGSIGGELCRQLARLGVRRLAMLDICERGLFELTEELRESCPVVELVPIVASIRDELRMNQVLSELRPDTVCHAAAHKHVPLMELAPEEAVKNNIFGTLITARASINADVRRFVLISTDKAVEPMSVMGATKRFCELLLPMLRREGTTEFTSVRFGNVLGSSGSVVPLFVRQIERGGPITITDPRVTRYFMTIPEAVSLVLRAITLGEGQYVLDMGEPIAITELAQRLIRLSGRDVRIEYVGLRLGERLEEALFYPHERPRRVDERILSLEPESEREGLVNALAELRSELVSRGDMKAALERTLPEYRRQ